MIEAMHDLIGKLTSLAYKVTNTTNADVFIDYSGHVNYITVRVYKDGWDTEKHAGIRHFIDLSNPENVVVINGIIKELEDLLY